MCWRRTRPPPPSPLPLKGEGDQTQCQSARRMNLAPPSRRQLGEGAQAEHRAATGREGPRYPLTLP
jgi:hypothetical protein